MSLPPLVEPASELTVDEVRRYSRHLIIPDVGMDGQKRLKNAKVLCVGAGGLGSPALMYLAAAGVGTLGIVEFDEVDESNLQRQIIHSQADIGRSKAESARDSVLGINPYVNVVLHEERLEADNVMDIFSQYDLIVDGTDNFATRYLVNDACVLLNKPYVWGSIYRFDGQASVFWSEHGPCYRCLYPEPPPPGMVPSCAEGGVLGVLCASIGSIQVTEAIKVLTGTGEPLVGRLMIYDALEMQYRQVKVRKDPNCAVCGENPTVTELIDYEAFCGVVSEEAQEAAAGSTITPKQLKEWIDDGENIEIIDVREINEYEIVSIPGAKLIPKNEFLMGTALETLPQDKKIVLHCKTGVRSAEVLAVLKSAGFADAVHVGGGVIGWVNQTAPHKPVYSPTASRAGAPHPACRAPVRCSRYEAQTLPSFGTVPSSRYAFTVESTQSLPLPYAPCPSPFQVSSTPTPLPSPSAIFRAPSYGVAGSPVLPTTRIGAAPGALTSGWSYWPATGQSWHQPAVSHPRKSPNTGEIFSNVGSSLFVCAAVGRCLSSRHDMTRCEWVVVP